MRSLRRQVAAGESLGLVFPIHDFEFVYGDGDFNIDQGAVGQIQVGKRLPHFWFAVAVRGRELILSSIELCSGFDSRSDSRPPPLIIALVDSLEKQAWESELQRLGSSDGVVHLIAVQSPQTTLDHRVLQRRYQTPHYTVDSPAIGTQAQPDVDPPHLDKFNSELQPVADIDAVVDVSGRFNQLMNNGERRRRAVLVRPDGHVIGLQADSALGMTLADALTALKCV